MNAFTAKFTDQFASKIGPIAARVAPSATNMIRMDHSHVVATYHQFEAKTGPKTKRALVNTVCLALEIHAQLEEEIFYPALRAVAPDNPVILKSVPEHDEMRRLISRLRGMEPTDAEFDNVFHELMRDVMHHVADEESTLLPEAERLLGDRLGELGAQMTKRRFQLATPRAGEIASNMARSIPATSMAVAAGGVLASALLVRQLSRRR